MNKYEKISEEDIIKLIINTTIISIDSGPDIISPSNIASLLKTSRYQVNKHIKTLVSSKIIYYNSIVIGYEDDYSFPYNGYGLTEKGREKYSEYIKKRREEELKLIEECFNKNE